MIDIKEDRKIANKVMNCAMKMCKTEFDLYQTLWERVHKKLSKNPSDAQYIKYGNKLKHSEENINLEKCKYESCKENVKKGLAMFLEMLKEDNPKAYKRGMKLLKNKNATGLDYAKYITTIYE